MMFSERRRRLQTLTPAQHDRRQIDRQLRRVERNAVGILRRLGQEAHNQWPGYASPSPSQIEDVLHRANLEITANLKITKAGEPQSLDPANLEITKAGEPQSLDPLRPNDDGIRLRPNDDGIRARRAGLVLLQIRDARTHLDDNNAPRAAYAAIQAAVFGGDLLMHAVTVVAGRQRGGRTSAAPYRHAEQLCQEKIADLLEAGPSLSVSCIADHILRTTLADVTLPGKEPRPVSKRTVRTWIRRRKLETAKR